MSATLQIKLKDQRQTENVNPIQNQKFEYKQTVIHTRYQTQGKLENRKSQQQNKQVKLKDMTKLKHNQCAENQAFNMNAQKKMKLTKKQKIEDVEICTE